VAGDFNEVKLKSVVQPEEKQTLDHLYPTHRDAYKALHRPPFGKSDHNSILLIPAYKQKLKQEVPMTRSNMEVVRKRGCYATGLFCSSETGICSRIHTMALRSIPPQSQASSISALTTLSPQ
jgi:hypothetical protein